MIYDYECNQCKQVTEAIRKVKDRDNAPLCSKCGGRTRKIISSYNVHADIQPYVDEHIGKEPIYIKSRKHREQVMKANGVFENFGKGWH